MKEIIYKGIKFTEPDFTGSQRGRGRTLRKINAGIIKRQSCEICNKENANAHHETYTDESIIRWLCPSHHSIIHKLFRKDNLNAIDNHNYFTVTVRKQINELLKYVK